MAPPKLYNIKETAVLIRMSESWLYRNAGVTIPVTRIAGTRRLFWTEEQITEIIRSGAQPARAAKRAASRRETPAPAPQSSVQPSLPVVKIPRARPERSRRYRPSQLD